MRNQQIKRAKLAQKIGGKNKKKDGHLQPNGENNGEFSFHHGRQRAKKKRQGAVENRFPITAQRGKHNGSYKHKPQDYGNDVGKLMLFKLF